MQGLRRICVPAALVAMLSLLLAAGAQGIGAPSGSGGAIPDLVITKTATRTTALVGDEVVYYIRVNFKADKKITKTASQVVVTDPLPAGVTLVSTYADRGPGCTLTTTLTCPLDFISGAITATITIRTRVTQVGTIVNTASVTSSENDPDLSNNSASATVTVTTPTPPAPPPPPPAPPRLIRSGAPTLQASRSAGAAEVSFRLFVSEPATLGVKAADPRTGSALRFARGSRLGAAGTETAVTSLTTSVDRTKVVRVKLRFDAGKLVKGKVYRVSVSATDGDGTTTLAVPFRA